MGNINVFDKIVIEKIWTSHTFFYKYPSKIWFRIRNRITDC